MTLETLITGIFILATVFGIGVMAVEMLGLLGDLGQAGDGGDGGAEAGGDGGGDGGDAEAEGSDGKGYTAPAGKARDWGNRASTGRRLFAVLWILRLTVYFSIGFGPVGLIAILLGSRPGLSLLWAVPGGVITAFLARTFFKFQQQEFDSTVTDSDLIGRQAVVNISIHPGEIGRVRIQLEQLVKDRYARGEDPQARFGKGEQVIISHIDDQGVHVRSAKEADEP